MDEDAILQVAAYMPLFPLFGALIGFCAGVFAWALEGVFPVYIAGTLGLGFLVLLNGAQHVDGLLDFGDGLMCHGSRARKLRVMQDPHAGTGGLVLAVIVLMTTAFAFASFSRTMIIQVLVASEAVAAFSMVLEASIGRPAQQGMGSIFLKAMKSKHRGVRLLVAVVLAVGIAFLILGFLGATVVLAAVFVTLILLAISERSFGGITGDIMGATNELTRLVLLLAVLGAIRWV
jgi:adenosylcobinamide-GDP ribazoletransferase